MKFIEIENFEEVFEKAYNVYLKYPLLTNTDNGENIYELEMCVITGLGIMHPKPHRHYTFLEFVYACGKNEEVYNKFVKPIYDEYRRWWKS